MTSAAMSDCHALLAAVCALPEKIRLATISQSNPYNTLEQNTLPPLIKGNFGQRILNAVKTHRNAIVGGGISDAVIRNMLDPVLLTYGVAIQSPWSDPVQIFDDLYDRFVLSGLTVKSRVFSFGAATGSTVGNGAMVQLTADWNAKTIESQFGADTITVKCVRDVLGGASKHEEEFEIRGLPAGIDRGYERGPGGDPVTIRSLSARNSTQAGVVNPSFSQVSPATSGSVVTSLTGWTLSGASFTGITVRTTSGLYYRDSVGDSSPKALAFDGNHAIYQSLARLRLDVPYLIQIAYKPVSAGNGTLHLIVGDQSVSATLSGTSGWNVLRMTIGQKCWARSFNTTNPRLKLKITSNATGHTILDDVVFAEMTKRDSLYYAIVGGTTKWLEGDKKTFTNTETGAIVQRWLARAYRKYLPSTSGSPTVVEPTVS